MSTGQKSQSELLADKLKLLKPNVTSKDRERVIKITSYSASVISTYLNGNVRDLDTATTLIVEFTKLIAARAKKAGVSNAVAVVNAVN